MFRELIIFICAVGVVRASALRHKVPVAHNEATQSPVVISTPAPEPARESKQYYGVPAAANSVRVESHQPTGHSKDYATSPTVTTHQSVAHTQPKHHPALSIDRRVATNPEVVKTISRPVPVRSKSVTVESYESPNIYQQPTVYDGISAPGPVYYAGNINYAPEIATYATNTATVRPHYAIPVEENSVTIESNGELNVHHPGAYAAHHVTPGVTYANNAATVRPYYAVPVEANTVTIESNGEVNVHPPAAYAAHHISPGVTYASNAATVRPYYAVPVEANTVTIESNGAVSAQRPGSFDTYHINPAVAYANNAATVRPYYAVPVEPKTVTIDSNGVTNAHHPAAYGTHHVGPTVTYLNNAAPTARPYFAVPVQAKTVTIQSDGAVNGHPPAYDTHHHVDPAVNYVNNAASVRPYYAVPVQAKTVTIESNGAINGYSPFVYATHHFANNAAPIRPYYAVPGAAKTISVGSHGADHANSPGVAYVVNIGNNVGASAKAQYAAAPGIQYSVNPYIKSEANIPVASRRISADSLKSVTAHPASPHSPGLLRYAPVTVAKPIPVPVIYQNSDVNTHHASAQQFAVVNQNVAPTAATYARAPVRAQTIPVQVFYPTSGNHDGTSVRYQPASVPVVHANSFVDKVFAPVGPTHIPVAPAGPQHDYARAVSYSPASAVSSVTFNGLGVSYGW